MLKKCISVLLGVSIAFSLIMCAAADTEENVSEYEAKINGFDPEYVMWTNQMIDEGFYALSPNQSNKEADGLSDRKPPYGSLTDKNLTKWAEYEFLWTHGYPVGNGRMAAVVMGGIDKEVIQINEDTVWTGSPYVDSNGNPTSGTTADAWRYYRGANADGTPADIGSSDAAVGDASFQAAFPAYANQSISKMALEVSNEKNADAVQQRWSLASMVEEYFLGSPQTQKAYQSFVETYLDFGQKNEGVTNYTKALNMRDATVTVDYDYDGAHYTRETIASYPHQTVATNIKSEGKELKFDAELHTYLEKNIVFSKVSDNQIKVTGQVNKTSNGNLPGGASSIKIEARLYVEAQDGAAVTVSSDNKKITIEGGNEATVYVVGATNYADYLTLDDTKPEKDCDLYMSKITNKTYDQIKTAHENDYKELFERSYITLGNNGFDPTGIPTEKRIRKDLSDGSSGFSVAGGTSLANANSQGVYSTFNDGDNQIASLDFNYGKYLMIAGSREDSSGIPMSQPLNLTGKWNPSLSPSWSGKYTININTEMNYWLAQPLNIAECEEPLLDVFKDLAESGSITAREQYGIYNERGDDDYKEGDPWVMHHNFDLWRGTQPIDNATAGLWPTGGAWLLDHAWQYYLYNNDEEYLEEFYPLMKGACAFFTQFLVLDSQTGYLITAASCSPEQGSVQPGPAMDTQLIRNLYDSTIKAAKILGKDTEDSALIAKMEEQLPNDYENDYLADEAGKIAPDLIDSAGLIQEWARGNVTFDFSEKTDGSGKYTNIVNPFTGETTSINEHSAGNNTTHRHCSHLWELYPGTHVNQYSENEHDQAVFKAYQNSVAARSPGDSKGWALAWRIALSARALDGESAYSRIEQLLRIRTSPNMFGQHPNFQIDCNYGLTAGMVEMLMQSHNQTIDILPALPSKWSQGKFKGFKARGNVEVSASWKKGVPTKVAIIANDGGEVKVRNPYMGCAVVKDEEGNEVASVLSENNTVISFAADDGAEYTITGFGIIPQEEGTTTKEWVKEPIDASTNGNAKSTAYGAFSGTAKANGTVSLPQYETNGDIGYFWNDLSGNEVGFAYPSCEIEGLEKLALTVEGKMDGTHSVSIKIDSKDGQEIAAEKTFTKGKSTLEWDITDTTLMGTEDLYLVFKGGTDSTGLKDGDNGNWFVNVYELTGTRRITFVNSDPLKVYKGSESYVKNAVTAGDYTFEVDFDKLDGVDSAVVVIAYYDEDGKLISEERTKVDKTNNKVNETVTNSGAKLTMKVMIWNDLDTLKPIRQVKEFA